MRMDLCHSFFGNESQRTFVTADGHYIAAGQSAKSTSQTEDTIDHRRVDILSTFDRDRAVAIVPT